MKYLGRIFSFAKPFLGLMFLAIFLNILFSILGSVSTMTIQPVFQLLFESKSDASVVAVAAPMQLDFLHSLKESFFNIINHFVLDSPDLRHKLINLCVLILALFALKNIVKYYASITSKKVEEGVVKNIRDTVFSRIIGQSIDFFIRRKSGYLVTLIASDSEIINGNVISAVSIVIREFVQVVIFLIALLAISPYLTVISIGGSLVGLIFVRYGVGFIKKYARRMQTAISDYTTIMQESLNSMRIVKAYSAEIQTAERFSEQTAKYVKSAVKHEKINAIIPGINEIFAIFALTLVLYVGGLQTISGALKSSDLMLFIIMLFSIMSPISTIIQKFNLVQRGFVAAERVFETIDAPTSINDGSQEVKSFNDKISLKNVSFSYNPESVVLNNISIDIEKGKKIAIVGASGAGKSTILDLIIRFYDPLTGKVEFDGKDIKDFKLDEYRKLFGVVSQEALLFNDTISNNIKYGSADISDEKIINAAKIANAYKFVSDMPEGFNTIIGDRGAKLSGGERQRIAIARALARDPEILIFDEATSALDAESEKIVQNAIDESLKDKTAVIIAHRLSTIVNCDQILVLHNGDIVEKGSHAQLIEQNGYYANLYKIQYETKKKISR